MIRKKKKIQIENKNSNYIENDVVLLFKVYKKYIQ